MKGVQFPRNVLPVTLPRIFGYVSRAASPIAGDNNMVEQEGRATLCSTSQRQGMLWESSLVQSPRKEQGVNFGPFAKGGTDLNRHLLLSLR